MIHVKVELMQTFGVTTLDMIACDIVEANNGCLLMQWLYGVEIIEINEVKK